MTILNSMNEADSGSIKYTNIIINSITATILSLVGNFKLAEREVTYKQTHKRMKKLYYQVDIILRTEPEKINAECVGNITKEYVNIYEHLEYPIPYFVIWQFNKGLETEAVAKKKQKQKQTERTKQTKRTERGSQESQETRESQETQETRESRETRETQEEQTIQVEYNDVLFNSQLTFANNFMNDNLS
jgi:hypothetical protein